MSTSPMFADLYELIDAVMLFGATVEPCKTGSSSYRIVVARRQSRWQALYWVIALLHRHGLDLRLKNRTAQTDSKIAYATPGSIFYAPAFHRWYPSFAGDGVRRATVPQDVRLTEPMLAVWLVDAMTRKLDGELKLAAPRMSERIAAQLARQIRQIGWPAKAGKGSKYSAIRLAGKHRPAVSAWLDERFGIPAVIWSADGEVAATPQELRS